MVDVVGGQWAVIESDPGVFTGLVQKLGARSLSFVEVYDTSPHLLDHLDPHGLIFCFDCSSTDDSSASSSTLQDTDARDVWFAHQLIDDACASLGILNVLFNCENVTIGETLEQFRDDTRRMSATMRGLAVSNADAIREAHNSLARPADIRGSLYAAYKATEKKSKEDKDQDKTKKRKTSGKAKRLTTKKSASQKLTVDQYHFIGFVPRDGRVWELDGLASGPIEVGEIEDNNWLDTVRPALRHRMRKFNADNEGGSDIRFSLLALVDDPYCKASDELELEKRRRTKLEMRLSEGGRDWSTLMDPQMLALGNMTPNELKPMFANNVGSRRQLNDMAILTMSDSKLPSAWNECIQRISQASFAVDDELQKSTLHQTDHVQRTFDYEPFVKEYIKELYNSDLLYAAAGRDSNGKILKK